MKVSTLMLILFFCLNLQGRSQNVGDKAPDFTIQQLTGGNFNLSGQTGKVVFIFWLGYACPYCKSAAPTVNSSIINTFKNRTDFVAIGVDTWDGSSSQVQSFQTQTGLSINYLIKGSSAAQTWKTTYDRLAVVDPNGKIVFKGTQGASSDIENAKKAIENALPLTTSILPVYAAERLFNNFPNPFSAETTIEFQLNKSSHVSIKIVDITGKAVKELVNREFPSGENSIRFQRGNLKEGIYFLRMKNEEQVMSRKMIIQ
jgi:peroxiredoxin